MRAIIAITCTLLLLSGCIMPEKKTTEIRIIDNTETTPFTMLVRTSSLAAGDATCAFGGIELKLGYDDNGNAELDLLEITESFAICYGEDGLDSPSQLINIGDEPSGANCPFGGMRIDFGFDSNFDNSLEASEIEQTKLFCNQFNQISHSYYCLFTLKDQSGSLTQNLYYGSYRLDELRSGEIELSAEIMTPNIGIAKTVRWSPSLHSEQWHKGLVRINFDVMNENSGYKSNGGYWEFSIDRQNTSGDVTASGSTDFIPNLIPESTLVIIKYVDADLGTAPDNEKVWPENPTTVRQCIDATSA